MALSKSQHVKLSLNRSNYLALLLLELNAAPHALSVNSRGNTSFPRYLKYPAFF
jgi:hypothetical protein